MEAEFHSSKKLVVQHLALHCVYLARLVMLSGQVNAGNDLPENPAQPASIQPHMFGLLAKAVCETGTGMMHQQMKWPHDTAKLQAVLVDFLSMDLRLQND